MGIGRTTAMQMVEAEAYDPEKLGARCDLCVLRTMRVGQPVGPELRSGSPIGSIVAEAPGEKEVEFGRPLVGQSGVELNESLKSVGATRQEFDLHNAIACRPPDNELDRVMLKWQRGNKKREKEGLEPLPSPIECCRPRLVAELDGSSKVLALGKTALVSLTRGNASILEVRGGPVEGHLLPDGSYVAGVQPSDAPAGTRPLRILPTLHPAFVVRARRWTRAFRSDLSRAHRWFTTGALGWVEPQVTYNPTPDELSRFLARTDIDYVVDLETTVDDPTVADLRTVGIGHEFAAVVCTLESIETGASAYTAADDQRVREILKEFFADPARLKIGHNAGYFDQMVVKQHFGVEMSPLVDTILLHRVVESELPHKLAYVGSVYTDVTAWKAAHTATEAQSDRELAHYNAVDCVVTARAAVKLADAAYLRNQMSVVRRDHAVQRMCVGLHENGLFVDRAARDRVAAELLAKIADYRRQAQAACGVPDLNPNSVPQLRTLLFEDWKLPPVDYTKLGDPSTNDESIRAMRSANRDDLKIVGFLDALRKYRKVAKEYGTYVRRLVPAGQPLDGLAFKDEDEEEAAERGLIMADGRVRPDYNAHGTTCVTPETWVLTCDGPRQIGRAAEFGPEGSEVESTGLALHDGDGLNGVTALIHPKPARCLRVKAALGIEVTGPAHHRIQVAPDRADFSRQRSDGAWEMVEPTWEWCRMDQLGPGAYVRVPIGMNVWGSGAALPQVPPRPRATNSIEVRIPDTATPELARFVGLYNADGSIHDANGSFSIRITNRTRPDAREQALDLARGLFGDAAVRADSDGVHVTSIALAEWAQAIGLGRGGVNKRAPDWVLASPREIVCEYLQGLSADSSLALQDGITPRWRFSNYESLAREVQVLLLNLGIPSSLRFVGSRARPNSWEVMVSGIDDVQAVCAITGQVMPPPVRFVEGQRRPKYIRRGNTLWLRVQMVEDAGVRPLRDVTVRKTHAFWSNGVVSHNSGRLSSSNPNAQNWPKHLRKLIVAQPGHAIVGADADQLELRIIVAIAQIAVYLEAFAAGKDPHAMTASLMFGRKFDELVPKSEMWDRLRKIAKSIKYASFYGSGDETVHGLVTSAEDDEGNLIYGDLTLREVSMLKRNWLKGIPELPRWWEDTMDEYRSLGHVVDPVWGRRRDFLDGEAFNEIVNHPVQCVPGWSRVLTKDGYVPIEQLRGLEFTAWTGKRWAPARVLYRGIKELHRVTTKRGMHFACDDDHRGKFVGREGYEWRKFVEAGQGARFAVDLAREHDFGQPMDELDAYVAGYWTGDGSSTPDGHHAHAVSFVVANGEGDSRAGEQMWAKLKKWAVLRGIELARREQEGCFQATFYKGATEWLRSIGADPAWKAHTKRVPESIWRADLAARKAFLRGFLDADGYASSDGAVLLNLCQHQLLQDTMVLARTVGIEGTIRGPYASDDKGHQAFRLVLNGAQTFDSVQWGRPCRLRTSTVGLSPRFECKRVHSNLVPSSGADRVIKSRVKTSATPSVSPYVLSRMGADGLYDHDAVTSVNTRRIFVPVFTLEVDDADHQYVVEGVISKNSAGAHIIHDSTFDLLTDIPFGKWGPGTGLISQVHDAVYVEAPCPHPRHDPPKLPNGKPDEKQREFGWCPPKCQCPANWAARRIEAAMNRKVPGLDGVVFSATAKIGKSWGDV